MELPLLKGMSRARLQEIVGRLKLNFTKAEAGSRIIEPGSPCTHLCFLLNGSVRMTLTGGADGDFTVKQTLTAPNVIAPEFLFGLSTEYPCGVEALTPAGLMKISKDDYRKLLGADQVLLFNYLNAVSSSSQRSLEGLLGISGGNARERLVYWVTTLTQPGSTDIEFSSNGRELRTVLGMSERSLRPVLERLAAAGAVSDITPYSFKAKSRSALLQ